ncbi:uncharacterized protein LOC117335077 [Pecten maximus]|uniref:uncharacterized protein LOC117335077 n=1 Tax=Pecten maximus TaxID=6579 RepID=UPI001458E7A6|nr:uncharacterized protein LOC117335077 [Pecten maximus]
MLSTITKTTSPSISTKTTAMSTLSVRMSTMLPSLLSSSTTKRSSIATTGGETSSMTKLVEEVSTMVKSTEEMSTAPQLPSSPQMMSTKMTTTNTYTATTATTPVLTSVYTFDTTSTNIPCTRRQPNISQLSQAELLDAITQLKAELAVSKNNTSTYRRKRISVYESKPSSMVMGGVACAIMSVVIGWIIVPDFITMCMFLFKLGHKAIIGPS